jgi:succinate-acetate transporter protein
VSAYDNNSAARDDNHLAARIFLRPIGVPLPLGVAGLAIASFVDSGLELHWINHSQTREVGLILVAVPFLLQLIACVLSYLARDGATGATLGVLACTWLALGLIHIASPASRASGALGLLLLIVGASVALSALAVGTAKPLPAVLFLAAALRFELAGIYQLSTASAWEHASGILGLVISGLAAYCVIAFELEGQNHGPVLPTFRRGPGAAALRDSPRAQLDQVAHEPGVRRPS